MRKLTTCACLLLVIAVSAEAQTNPCTATTTTTLNPGTIYATLPEHDINEADGQPRVTEYRLAYFNPTAVPDATLPANATPVVPAVPVAKTSFTLVTGTTNCYQTPYTAITWAGSWPLVAGLKAVRAARTNLPAAESEYRVSNPFGMAPSALASPGLVVVR